MSYFVVERGGDSGGLRIPLPTAYETREAAIAALSAATGSGEVTLTGEVFIADLGSAVPVLVMAAVAPVAPVPASVEEPATEVTAEESMVAPDEGEPAEAEVPAEAEDRDEVAETVSEVVEAEPGDFIIEDTEPGELDQESADEVYTSWESIPDVATGSARLADALKRAATTLEDDGIVAPDSVLSEPGDDESVVEELLEDEEALGEPPVEEVSDEEEDSEWPWANVESYEVSAVPADDVPAEEADLASVVSEPASVISAKTDIEALVESLGGDAPIITSAPPEGEEVYVPHPVILGDYADAVPEPEALLEDLEVAAEEELEDLEPVDDAALSEVEPDVSEAAVEESGADASAVVLDSGYAPTGDLDLGEYTCQDCVYSNTCPKVGQVTPAECGSFQWKSE